MGFQSTGEHFWDLDNVKLEPEERAEDFIEDNLLTHPGEDPENEEISSNLENMTVLTWLRLVHKDLPPIVKQRYCTEMRSKTIATMYIAI